MIDHSLYKEKSIQGRYINMEAIQPCFAKLPFPLLHIGDSVRGVEINAFKLGQGTKKVLMWSQMHGNESTTTKAVWDMVNFLQSGEPLAHDILKECSIMVVPMLNPDGANVYTRENINKVDLNRDAKNLTQPESIALRGLFESFQPDFCFNLHDQRTLFSAGNTNKSATVSFLSPASNAERHITPPREIAMKLIVGMNTMLQKYIPGQVGRYDDGFNDNCVGDTFQMLGVPTVLFESGHYPGDYEREKTREYIFLSILEALKIVANDGVENYKTGDYFSIPGNRKLFFDILIKNPEVVNPVIEKGYKVGIRFKEVLRDNKVIFKPEITEIGPLEGFYGHQEIECIDTKDFGFTPSQQELIDLLQKIEK
ncbi:MAG: peptidase M14 [Muricauda sp.]|nr:MULTISPECIES: M14 metallopeptidase family protein [unclassified Allomuricauda]MAU16062.1 peptidase M14 [Allomuricauda sp.]|tara:strand:- start:3306 stop:4409 length:1104 start_codon:yes stop_codon:yes gene_type:complete